MKISTFFLFSVFFLSQYVFCNSHLRKVKTKGDIPKFCSSSRYEENRVKANLIEIANPIENSPYVLTKTINNTILNSEEKNTNYKSSPKMTILKKIYSENNFQLKLFQTIFGLYLYFIFLNFLKILEEAYRYLLNFIESRFSHFQDLTLLNYPEMENLENKFIYTSGLLFFQQPAVDPVFNIDYGKVFLKIERRVSIYDFDKNCWMECEFNREIDINIYLEKIQNLYKTENESLSTYKNIYNKLKDDVFVGKATLRGVRLSEKHLKKIIHSETININNRESIEACENYLQKELGSERLELQKISFSIEDPLQKDFNILITDNESGNGIPFLKIKLIGVSYFL